jgi:hypothetical protein
LGGGQAGAPDVLHRHEVVGVRLFEVARDLSDHRQAVRADRAGHDGADGGDAEDLVHQLQL